MPDLLLFSTVYDSSNVSGSLMPYIYYLLLTNEAITNYHALFLHVFIIEQEDFSGETGPGV